MFINLQRNISKITERVISNTEKLLTCRKEIISPYDIPTIKEKIKDAEEKLEDYEKKWLQCMLIGYNWFFFNDHLRMRLLFCVISFCYLKTINNCII